MAKLIDVLDENGVKTGEVATRDEVHRKGLWHRIAVVAVVDAHGHILLQQRAEGRLTNPGKWDIAAAGHIDAGETSLTTAEREVAEEVGIDIDNSWSVKDFHFVFSYRKEGSHTLDGEKFLDRQYFDCFLLRKPEIDTSRLVLQTSEVQDVRLCDLDEFEQMMNSGVMVNRRPFYDEVIRIIRGKNA